MSSKIEWVKSFFLPMVTTAMVSVVWGSPVLAEFVPADIRPLSEEQKALVLDAVVRKDSVYQVEGGISENSGNGYARVIYPPSESGRGCIAPVVGVVGEEQDGEWGWEIYKEPYLSHLYFPDEVACDAVQVEDGIRLSQLIDTDTLERLLGRAISIYRDATDNIDDYDLPSTYESITNIGLERLAGRTMDDLKGRVVYTMSFRIDAFTRVQAFLRYDGNRFVLVKSYVAVV